jgi:hypothetical protein
MVRGSAPVPIEPRTLSGVLADLEARGFGEHFRVVDEGHVQALSTGDRFRPSQVSIAECHRFEGISDPDDMAILYAIETRTGVRGTIADAFGVYTDPLVGGFMQAVVHPLIERGHLGDSADVGPVVTGVPGAGGPPVMSRSSGGGQRRDLGSDRDGPERPALGDRGFND